MRLLSPLVKDKYAFFVEIWGFYKPLSRGNLSLLSMRQKRHEKRALKLKFKLFARTPSPSLKRLVSQSQAFFVLIYI
jgi:hypothetical protein